MDLPKPHSWGHRTVQIMGVLVWLILITGIFYFLMSAPQGESFLHRHIDQKTRDKWDMDQVRFALTLFKVNLGLCIFGFLVNWAQVGVYKRHFNRSLLIVSALTLLAYFHLQVMLPSQ